MDNHPGSDLRLSLCRGIRIFRSDPKDQPPATAVGKRCETAIDDLAPQNSRPGLEGQLERSQPRTEPMGAAPAKHFDVPHRPRRQHSGTKGFDCRARSRDAFGHIRFKSGQRVLAGERSTAARQHPDHWRRSGSTGLPDRCDRPGDPFSGALSRTGTPHRLFNAGDPGLAGGLRRYFCCCLSGLSKTFTRWRRLCG